MSIPSSIWEEHTSFPQETTFLQPFLNWPSIQLNIHTTENCANTELGRGWDFMLFLSHCSADSSSELFHEHTISLQLFSIGRASNWTYTRLRIARILNWAEGEVLLVRLSRFKFEAFPLIDSQFICFFFCSSLCSLFCLKVNQWMIWSF